MERLINPLPTVCGAAAGLAIGVGQPAGGILLAMLGIGLSCILRARMRSAEDL